MGRLTYLKNGRPCLLINGSEYFGPVAERLHAYEETGYEPGEIPVEAVKIWTGEQDYDLEDVGRYIFTTREAAEASLRKEPGNA